MSNWTRPYGDEDESTIRYAVATVMSVLSLFVFCGAVFQAATPWAAIPLALFFGLFQAMVWRVLMVGLYIGDQGIKVRMLARTQVIAWSAVDHVWAGRASQFDAWAIWISVHGSERDIETPIWRRGSPARHRNREKLDATEFASIVGRLNAEVARRSSRQL
jgi:hypothetical protein